jgi:hypothetical protein
MLILDGSVDPYLGARFLDELSHNPRMAGIHDLDPFTYAADEYEDLPEDRGYFRREIMAEAARWV